MGNQETAEAFLAAWASADSETMISLCTDNFTFSGAMPEPVDAQMAAGLGITMQKAFPDIQYNTKIESVEGNVVNVLNQLTGTHTADFDLTPMGMGVIPATGKSFSLPEEPSRLTFEGDKIANYHINASADGGLPGILAQLGIENPHQH